MAGAPGFEPAESRSAPLSRHFNDLAYDENARHFMLDVAAYYDRLAARQERSLPALVDAASSVQRAVTVA